MTVTGSTATMPRPARLRRNHPAGDYDRDGYLIIEDLLDPATLGAARAESLVICRGDRGAVDGVTPAGVRDHDHDVLRRYLCVHFPHKISPVLRDLACLPAVVHALTNVIGPNVKMMQSMLFIKSRADLARPGTRTKPTSPPATVH